MTAMSRCSSSRRRTACSSSSATTTSSTSRMRRHRSRRPRPRHERRLLHADPPGSRVRRDRLADRARDLRRRAPDRRSPGVGARARGALRRLAHHRPRRPPRAGGAFVSDTNVDQVAESISTMIQLRRMTLSGVAEARTVVETATSELAAERADPAAILRIEQTVEKGRSVVREQAPHTEASMDFHVAVADAAKNELLAATVAAYRDLLVQTLHDMRDVRSAKMTQKAHEEILDAIRAHDPDAARKLMLEHLRDFEKRLRRWLATQEQTTIVTRARHRPARTG